jgi:hypothetical protein
MALEQDSARRLSNPTQTEKKKAPAFNGRIAIGSFPLT